MKRSDRKRKQWHWCESKCWEFFILLVNVVNFTVAILKSLIWHTHAQCNGFEKDMKRKVIIIIVNTSKLSTSNEFTAIIMIKYYTEYGESYECS